MQSAKQSRLSREELIQALEDLARQLKAGTLTFEGREWTVPEKLQAHIELKEKKGRLNGKIKWRWSTLGDYEAANRAEVTHWEANLKDLKKQMGKSFAALLKAAKQNTFPSKDMLQRFIDQSHAFQQMADSDWQPAMNEYQDHIENLKRAVQDQRMQDFQHELRDLKARKTMCHKELK